MELISIVIVVMYFFVCILLCMNIYKCFLMEARERYLDRPLPTATVTNNNNVEVVATVYL